MMSFFSWNGGASSSSSSAPSSDTAAQLQRKLLALCQDLQALALVRPLGVLLTPLAQVLQRPGLPAVALEGAKQAIDFLRPSLVPEKLLGFLLAARSDKDSVRRFAEGVQNAMAAACQLEGEGSEVWDELLAASQKWLGTVESLSDIQTEVFELHFYLVFLDIKGDRALLEHVCRRLCRVLKLPVKSLVACLTHTRPWAEDALKELADCKQLSLLKRHHLEALKMWRVSWQERMQQAPEGKRIAEEGVKFGTKFWDSNFIHLFKIAWPDFVEAFEHFYLCGRCPADLVRQLRLRVDPSFSHQVTRHSWQRLLQGHSRITDIVDMLLEEVVQGLSSCIYRPKGCGHPDSDSNGEVQQRQSVLPAGPASGSTAQLSEMKTTQSRAWAASIQQAPASKPKPWFPFAHNAADDADMAIPTPHDARNQIGLARDLHDRQPRVAWDDFVANLCAVHRPWWDASKNEAEPDSSSVDDMLRAAALRSVDSSVACTHRALIFHIVSGDLAQNKPVFQMPQSVDGDASEDRLEGSTAISPRQDEVASDLSALPALVVTANGTQFSGVTKFGRSSSRRTLVPDCPMSEPIASRSHFNVVYEQDTDRYYLMDAGSKWGTFVKISSSVTLSCGDWIRVGGVEFIIRFCGGSCKCFKRHAHYRLHSLRLIHEQQAACKGAWGSSCRSAQTRHSSGYAAGMVQSAPRSSEQELQEGGDEDGSSDEEGQSGQLQNELLLLLSSRRPRGWMTSSARLCQQSARLHCQRNKEIEAFLACCAISRPQSPGRGATCVPIAPLELDFISGPRMGEKLVLCERVCTLGRGEGNTIQVTDSQLASVSRVHCIFEFIGNRWRMRDNGSTNGTWRRLSCVLEPSEPVPVDGAMSIQAGTHEFFVKEAEMRQHLIPYPAVATLEDLCDQEKRQMKSSEDMSPTNFRGTEE